LLLKEVESLKECDARPLPNHTIGEG